MVLRCRGAWCRRAVTRYPLAPSPVVRATRGRFDLEGGVQIAKTLTTTGGSDDVGTGTGKGKGKGKKSKGKGKSKGSDEEEEMVDVPKLGVGSPIPEFVVAMQDEYGNYIAPKTEERKSVTVALQVDGSGLVCKTANSNKSSVDMVYRYDPRDDKAEAQVGGPVSSHPAPHTEFVKFEHQTNHTSRV